MVYLVLPYHCVHTNHLPSLPLIWTKFKDSHHNGMIITPLFLRNKIICYISPTIHKWEICTPLSKQKIPPPYPWLATLKIVKGMRVLFGTKATVYSKQSGSYGLQQIYTQPSPINPAKKTWEGIRNKKSSISLPPLSLSLKCMSVQFG